MRVSRGGTRAWAKRIPLVVCCLRSLRMSAKRTPSLHASRSPPSSSSRFGSRAPFGLLSAVVDPKCACVCRRVSVCVWL